MFVTNNRNKCTIVIDNKEYKISEKYEVDNNKDKILYIKLKGIDKITNMSFMFSNCPSLLSLPDISEWNTNNVTNMSYMFNKCLSLSSLPDISEWNTNNFTDMRHMFYECSSSLSLPDISKWNTNNITDIYEMFC